MQREVYFQMPKKNSRTIGSFGYARIVQVVKHAGQGSSDHVEGASEHFVLIPVPTGLCAETFLF